MKEFWNLVSIFGVGQMIAGAGAGQMALAFPFDLGISVFFVGSVFFFVGYFLMYKSYPYGMALRDGKSQAK